MRVLESALSPALKPTCVVMALFGDATGYNIYPSVGRVAHLLGVDPRTVERNLARLRDLGILVPFSTLEGGRLHGGRGRSVKYGLNFDALPSRESFMAGPKTRRTRQGSTSKNPDAAVGESDDFQDPRSPAPASQSPTDTSQSPTPLSSNPDAYVAEPRHQRHPILESDQKEVPVRENHRETAHCAQSQAMAESVEPHGIGEEPPNPFATHVIDALKRSNPDLHAVWATQRKRRAANGS